MSELDNNWRNAIQSLKFAYKDESTVSSNNADANFASDEPSEGTMELTNIDENRSYHSCIPMASDKYDVGKYGSNDFGLDSTMAGIIDVSSIYDDDDSDRNKLQLTQQDFFKIDTSELERKPTQDIQFDHADDLIHATEDLSVASGSETDGSSIIFNVWNEDYDGRPDPAVMERLTKAKKLPHGLDPFVVTQIKRAKIINKIKEIDDDDSSQGSCALMLDNVCMPRFCGNDELTDTGSVGSSLVESLREGSITASVEIDFFHHKRPKKTRKYALHSDRSFEPNKSPQELVLIVPKNQEVKENLSSVSSFLPVPIQQLTNEFDDDDTLDDGTYVEEDKEFTLQKYDRTPHRIAQLVLSGKKSEAKRYRVNETDNTADTTPSQPFVTPEEDVNLESHVIKAARFVEDEDPIECDRSFAGPSDESTSEEEIIEDEQTKTKESSFAEFLKLFSDPNYVSPNIINILEDEIDEEEDENEGSRENSEVVGSQIACAPIAAGDNNEDAYEPMFAMGSKMACVSRATVIDSDHVEPQEVPINQVLTTFSDLSEAGLGPEPTASTLTDACSLNPVGSSYSMNSPIQNRIASLDIANEINPEGGSSEGSMSFAGGQENCTPAIMDDTDITDSKIDLKITDAPKHNEPENTDNKDQVYVPGRRTISIAAINSSFFKEKPIETPKEITARPSLLHFATCCAPHTSLAVKDTDDSIQDLMAALDLTLECVPTASYSTAGEEVVMASPLSEGIVADQPNSKYGRIIAPEEFAKLQESFYKSMGLDDTILTEHGLATEVCHDDRSNNQCAFTQEASDGDFEQKCESSSTETSSIEIIESSEISVELEVIPSMPQAGCDEIEANNKTKDQKQNQELKISTSSSDQFFFDSVESPSRLPLNNSPTKTEDSFSVADESKVDVAILDIIDDLKSEENSEHTQPKQPIPMVKQKMSQTSEHTQPNQPIPMVKQKMAQTSEHTQPRQPVPMVKQKMAQTSEHTKPKQPIQNKMASIPESKSNNAASISTEAQNSTARRYGKKKTSQSSKRSLDSKAKKTEEGSIMDDLAALKRTMVKNSTRSKIRVKSGAGSLGMKSNSLLDNLPQRKKELNSS